MAKYRDKTLIIGVTGLPASGKNEFAEVAKTMGFKQIVMGDVIRNECRARGLEPTRENCNNIMVLLRKEEGYDVVAKRVLKQIKSLVSSGESYILVDGIRSPQEVDVFKAEFPDFLIIAIHASPSIRKMRTLRRKRNDDSTSSEAFLLRDKKELEVGIGHVIALADYMLTPPNNLEKARAYFKEFLTYLMNE